MRWLREIIFICTCIALNCAVTIDPCQVTPSNITNYRIYKLAIIFRPGYCNLYDCPQQHRGASKWVISSLSRYNPDDERTVSNCTRIAKEMTINERLSSGLLHTWPSLDNLTNEQTWLEALQIHGSCAIDTNHAKCQLKRYFEIALILFSRINPAQRLGPRGILPNDEFPEKLSRIKNIFIDEYEIGSYEMICAGSIGNSQVLIGMNLYFHPGKLSMAPIKKLIVSCKTPKVWYFQTVGKETSTGTYLILGIAVVAIACFMVLLFVLEWRHRRCSSYFLAAPSTRRDV